MLTRARKLAHVSDLHIGRSVESDARAERLVRAMVDARIDHCVVTGDVTHRGRKRELARFEETFAPLRRTGRLTVIPGNHDRLGDDVGDAIMAGDRVQTKVAPGLFMVLVNSTGLHNRSWLHGHGQLDEADLDAVDAVLPQAPPDHLVVLMLHHHPLQLPEDRACRAAVVLDGLAVHPRARARARVARAHPRPLRPGSARPPPHPVRAPAVR